MPAYAFRRALALLADLIYPPRCPLCDRFVEMSDVPCEACSMRLRALEGDAHTAHLGNEWFVCCRSCFAYEDPIKEAIHGFKYSSRLDLARFFCGAMAIEAAAMGPFDIIVPVPLHRSRLAKRGFNQAVILARGVGRAIGTQVSPDILLRVQPAKPQAGLEKGERLTNVKGAFAVHEGLAAEIVDKNILLVDDVLTTGATANECAKVLVKARAASVDVLTLARPL